MDTIGTLSGTTVAIILKTQDTISTLSEATVHFISFIFIKKPTGSTKLNNVALQDNNIDKNSTDKKTQKLHHRGVQRNII